MSRGASNNCKSKGKLMEGSKERTRKITRVRKRGYRRFFKKPLKGFRYRNKKFIPPGKKSNTYTVCVKVPVPAINSKFCTEYNSKNKPFVGFEETLDLPPANGENLFFHGFDKPLLSDVEISQSFGISVVQECIIDIPQWVKNVRTLRVLSLFDGIGTGLYALEKLGIEVEAYFSSEVDDNAKMVLKKNFGGRLVMLGSVTSITEDVVQCLGRIDLVIGGSPCADLSLVNTRRRGFFGKGSSGILFFDFARVLRLVQSAAAGHHTQVFHLFENTFAMENRNKKIITKTLRCDPAVHCASTYVPMVRKRLFWGNIPGLQEHAETVQPAPHLQQYLNPNRKAATAVLPTLTTSITSQRWGKDKQLPVITSNGSGSYLTMDEMERLFGFPTNFTKCPGLTDTDRRKLVGKAWSVHVIVYLLRPLTHLFRQDS